MPDRRSDDDPGDDDRPRQRPSPPPDVPERRHGAPERGGRRLTDHEPPKKDADEDDDAKDDDDEGDDEKDDDKKKPKPPTHDPERRGSVQGKGGRRATDARDADKGDEGDEDKDDEKDGDDQDDKDGKKKKKPSPLKKTWVRVVIAIVVVLLLIALVWWLVYYFTHGRYIQSTNDAYVKADKVSVTAAVSAKVVRIGIVDNQHVKAGDLLVELDARANLAKVQQYAGQVLQARAEADQYRNQIAAQEATVAQYVAQAKGAEVQRDYYAGEVRRYTPLVAAGAEKAEQLAQLREQRDQAAQGVLQYRAQELSARRQVAALRSQVAQADAKVVQAAAQQAQTSVDVDNSTVRAAVEGRVGDRQVFPGTYVNTGTQMMTIIPIDAIYVEANFKETQLGLMRIGQPVTIKVDALDGARVSGTIESFQPATGAEFSVLPPQNATGNFTKIVQRVPVRIRLDAGPEARRVLVPGLSVVVEVDTVGDKEDVDRRKKEEKDREDRVKQRREQEVKRDRERREPGPGR